MHLYCFSEGVVHRVSASESHIWPLSVHDLGRVLKEHLRLAPHWSRTARSPRPSVPAAHQSLWEMAAMKKAMKAAAAPAPKKAMKAMKAKKAKKA